MATGNVGGIWADLDINTSKLEISIDAAERKLASCYDALKMFDFLLDKQRISQTQYFDAVNATAFAIHNFDDKITHAARKMADLADPFLHAIDMVESWDAGLKKAGSSGMASYKQSMEEMGHTTSNFNTHLNQLSTKMNPLASGMLQLGYAVDDMQYGFRAIVNNIPMITMAFGGGPGLAGAVQMAAVAISQFGPAWEDIKNTLDYTPVADMARYVMELGRSFIDSAASAFDFKTTIGAIAGPVGAAVGSIIDSMVGLNNASGEMANSVVQIVSAGEKVKRSIVDSAKESGEKEDQKKIKDEHDAVKKLESKRTEAEEARDKAFKEAITEGGDESGTGMERLVKGIAGQRARSGSFAPGTDTEREIVEQAAQNRAFYGNQVKTNVGLAREQKRAREIEERFEAERLTQARIDIGKALAGDKLKQAQIINEARTIDPEMARKMGEAQTAEAPKVKAEREKAERHAQVEFQKQDREAQQERNRAQHEAAAERQKAETEHKAAVQKQAKDLMAQPSRLARIAQLTRESYDVDPKTGELVPTNIPATEKAKQDEISRTRRQMIKAGARDDPATAAHAKELFEKMMADHRAQAQELSFKHGTTFDKASRKIQEDAANKEEGKNLTVEARAKLAEKKRKAGLVHEADELIPGIGKVARHDLESRIITGGNTKKSIEKATEDVASALRKGGMKEAAANEAAAEFIKKGGHDIAEDVNSAMMGVGREKRASAIHSASDFYNQINSNLGGGGDTGKKQLQEQIKMRMLLSKMLQNQNRDPAFRLN